MLQYEPELELLRPLLGDASTNTLIARDRREVFSLHAELRILAWGGAMLLATAGGLVLKNNFERIGPLALSLLMAVAAAACYAFAWSRRARSSIVDDNVLLLGALLVSADLAFVEAQFHWFGDSWHHHFLILTVWHAVTAYLFRSRVVLGLSIAALAGWLGIRERSMGAGDFAWRAFACALLLLAWRALHQQFDRQRAARDFAPTFEHFAVNIGFLGCVACMFDDDTRVAGCLLGLVIAALSIGWGIRTKREAFVFYGLLFGVLSIDVLFAELVDGSIIALAFIIGSVIAAIAAAFAIHARVKEWQS